MKGKQTTRVRLPMQHYTETFKRKVCEEYLEQGVSKVYLLKKYNIRYRSAIQKWMKMYGYEDIHQKARYLNLFSTSSLAANKKTKPVSLAEQSLEKRIKELERLLEDEQLRSEAYQRMIAIAEKELNIPIRKKPNTK